MNPSTWTLATEVFTSARGNKTLSVSGKDGQKIVFPVGTPSEPCKAPWGAQTFQGSDSVRKTLEVDISPDMIKQVQAWEAHLKGELMKHSNAIFGKALTPEKVEDLFHSSLCQKGDYPTRLRLKTSHQTRYWDGVQKTLLPDADLCGANLVAQVTPACLWMMSREVGLTLLCLDVLCFPAQEVSCPW